LWLECIGPVNVDVDEALRLKPVLTGPNYWTGIKWAFLALMLGTFATSIVLLLRAGDERQLQVDNSAADKTRQVHVDKPLIIERKAGKMLWRLKARKAEQELSGSMHLTVPELELFSETGKSIPVTGREAWFNPLSKTIHFKGDVLVIYGEWKLYADEMSYDHASDTVHIPGDFRIEGKLTRARGQDLTFWRGDHHVRVEKAVWIEDRHPYKMQVMQ
jgi:Lipopolysaccharide-assembly, LptC-related